MKRNAETAFLKYYDFAYTSNKPDETDPTLLVETSVETPTTITPSINIIHRGSGRSQRTGLMILLRSVVIRGYLRGLVDSQFSRMARVLLVLDRQANGGIVKAEDVLLDPGNPFISFINMDYSRRFMVLASKIVRIPKRGASVGGFAYFTIKKKLRIPIHFDDRSLITTTTTTKHESSEETTDEDARDPIMPVQHRSSDYYAYLTNQTYSTNPSDVMSSWNVRVTTVVPPPSAVFGNNPITYLGRAAHYHVVGDRYLTYAIAQSSFFSNSARVTLTLNYIDMSLDVPVFKSVNYQVTGRTGSRIRLKSRIFVYDFGLILVAVASTGSYIVYARFFSNRPTFSALSVPTFTRTFTTSTNANAIIDSYPSFDENYFVDGNRRYYITTSFIGFNIINSLDNGTATFAKGKQVPRGGTFVSSSTIYGGVNYGYDSVNMALYTFVINPDTLAHSFTLLGSIASSVAPILADLMAPPNPVDIQLISLRGALALHITRSGVPDRFYSINTRTLMFTRITTPWRLNPNSVPMTSVEYALRRVSDSVTVFYHLPPAQTIRAAFPFLLLGGTFNYKGVSYPLVGQITYRNPVLRRTYGLPVQQRYVRYPGFIGNSPMSARVDAGDHCQYPTGIMDTDFRTKDETSNLRPVPGTGVAVSEQFNTFPIALDFFRHKISNPQYHFVIPAGGGIFQIENSFAYRKLNEEGLYFSRRQAHNDSGVLQEAAVPLLTELVEEFPYLRSTHTLTVNGLHYADPYFLTYWSQYLIRDDYCVSYLYDHPRYPKLPIGTILVAGTPPITDVDAGNFNDFPTGLAAVDNEKDTDQVSGNMLVRRNLYGNMYPFIIRNDDTDSSDTSDVETTVVTTSMSRPNHLTSNNLFLMVLISPPLNNLPSVTLVGRVRYEDDTNCTYPNKRRY